MVFTEKRCFGNHLPLCRHPPSVLQAQRVCTLGATVQEDETLFAGVAKNRFFSEKLDFVEAVTSQPRYEKCSNRVRVKALVLFHF